VTRRTWDEWLQLFFRAAAVATLVYLPWFVFAWTYYGSPVPQTVIAKSMVAPSRTLATLWHSLRDMGTFDALFMPAHTTSFFYWPRGIQLAGRITAIALSVAWVIPGLRTETKAASFTLLGSHLYLSFTGPTPWYLCLPALLGFVTLSGLIAQAISVARKIPIHATALKFFFVPISLTIPLVGAWLTVQSAEQLKLQQAIIENSTRREIGVWLREHAAPGDTVLLEPLGYIGYFSGLKTYDLPGLSSREVVEVERRFGWDWGAIADELHPEWMVLRPHEIFSMAQTRPHLLEEQYVPAREFNVRDQVASLAIYGREYLEYDSVFIVFRRRPQGRGQSKSISD
jgi:hypothetical protein